MSVTHSDSVSGFRRILRARLPFRYLLSVRLMRYTLCVYHFHHRYFATCSLRLCSWRNGFIVPHLLHGLHGDSHIRSCICARLVHRLLPLDCLINIALSKFVTDTAAFTEFVQCLVRWHQDPKLPRCSLCLWRPNTIPRCPEHPPFHCFSMVGLWVPTAIPQPR